MSLTLVPALSPLTIAANQTETRSGVILPLDSRVGGGVSETTVACFVRHGLVSFRRFYKIVVREKKADISSH